MSSDETLVYHQPKDSYSQRFSRSESDVESGTNPTKQSCCSISNFVQSIILGQVLSTLIAVTTSTTASLAQDNIQVPVLQCLFTYFVIGLVFSTYRLVSGGIKDYTTALLKYGGAYFLLASVDLLGNYLVLKSFSYTSLLSVILLDTWAIPVVMILSTLFMRTVFRWNHYMGAALGICGMVFLILMDAQRALTDDVESDNVHSQGSSSMLIGDLLCVLGATCYGISNVMQEAMAKRRHATEVTAMVGIFGTVAATLQLLLFDRGEIKVFGSLEDPQFGVFYTFVAALSLFYSLAPVLLKLTSAAFFNLSLLTADFYGLLVGAFILGISIDLLYTIPFCLTMAGIVVYNLMPSRSRDESLLQWIKKKRLEKKQALIERQNAEYQADVETRARELLTDPDNIQRQQQFV